jgi:hypothetical protein
METIVKHQGRQVTACQIAYIKELIKKHPEAGRTALSKKLCQEWNWVQANGYLQDVVCRGFLLYLEREGYITLPPRIKHPHNPLANRSKPQRIAIDTTPLHTSLKELQPLEFKQVRWSKAEGLFNSLIEEFHYHRLQLPDRRDVKISGLRRRAAYRLLYLLLGRCGT